MNRFIANLQNQAEENPLLAMAIAAGLITAISKLTNSSVNMRNAKAWQKEVDRRVKKS